MPLSSLSEPQRRTLETLAHCIVRGAPPSTETMADFVARCDARTAALPDHRRAALRMAIDALGSRAAALLALGRATPFAQLTDADQTRCFTAWAESRIPQLRTAHQAVRRLVLVVYYSRVEVAAATGYAGALHRRSLRVPWEGPLDGETVDHEPVARGARELPRAIASTPIPKGVTTARTMTMDVQRRADVVVIGSGAGGAVTAARLAEAGFEVVILEAGGYHTRADFDENEAALTERLYADGALRSTDDLSVSLLQGATVGGSSTVNWMLMLRTPPYVLDEWARDHGVYGMSPAEMAPVFARLEHELHARVVPDDAHSPNNRVVLDGAASLGWRASSAMINANGCVRCGFCGVGCRHDAKQSALVTFIPRALAAGAALYADADVTRVEVRERDTGNGTPPLKRVYAHVREGTQATRTLTIDAPVVVVAAGAVETPLLLQRSGLGGGGVGHWLRLHPTTAVFGHFAQEIGSSTGIPQTTMCDEFIRWNGTDYGFWIECPSMLPSFSAAAMPGFGEPHAEMMRTFKHTGVLIALTRDGANTAQSSGRVWLDRRGRSHIAYALNPADARRVRASIIASARMLLATGATEVGTLHTSPARIRGEADLAQLDHASLAPNRVGLFSAHVNGTCRMGLDPRTSGATPDGQRHGVRGLYISDGSLLPTALGVNPQETIMAVASVIADRMAAQHIGVTRG